MDAPTPGCAGCDIVRGLATDNVVALHPPRAQSATPAIGDGGQAATARSLYPAYDVEGLPDARHDEAGRVYNTGKVRAIRPDAQRTPSGTHRPPVLASEVLAEDLKPHEPGVAMLQRIACGCGVALIALSVWQLGASVAGIAVSLLGAGQLAVGLMPASYAARATTLVAISTALAAGATVAGVFAQGEAHPGLVLPVVALSTGLLFRSWHRASRQARLIVGVGLLLCTAWLAWSGSVDSFLRVNPSWQTWLPAATRVALLPILLLGLLAFMAETTTGGCAAWAGCVLGWYVALAIVETFANGIAQGISSARLIEALATPTLAVGIAQLLVVAASDPVPAAASGAQRPT